MEAALAPYEWLPETGGESGCAVCRLEAVNLPALFLKYGADRSADALTDEMARLRWLQPLVPVPKIHHFVCTANEAWLLSGAVPGITAEKWLNLNVASRIQTVTALAQFLRRFPSIPVEACQFHSGHQLRVSEARRNIDAGLVDESDFQPEHRGWSAEQVWNKMMHLLPADCEAVVTHGDFSLGNVLIEDGRVSGCIDVGRTGLADPYQDLAILWDNLGEFGNDLQINLLRAYGIGEPDHRKLQFYLCLDEFF